jgi:thiol-disulfide isomerase/thioredoxin
MSWSTLQNELASASRFWRAGGLIVLRKTSIAVAVALMMSGSSLPAQTGAAASRCDPKAKPAKLDFTLKDVNGKPVKLAAFAGKIVVLNFWATWCVPCRAEIPALVELQAKYGRSGLQVVGVSIDDPAEKMKPFVGQYKINYPVLQALGNDAILDTYGPMVVVPQTVVIERGGKMCTKHIGPVTRDALEQEIRGLL